MVKSLTYGGKGVGSQGDGTVQFLAKDTKTQKELVTYLQKEKGMTAYSLTLKLSTAVRKAVIPVAGFGTRLYPETRGGEEGILSRGGQGRAGQASHPDPAGRTGSDRYK